MEYNTLFYDKNYILNDLNTLENNNLKIAIHIHLYYIDMLDIFIDYLKNSPVNFTLFISVISEENKNICIHKINKNKLPYMDNMHIKIVENIGRDIAPLLIALKDELLQYDLVCHIHSKKSLHTKEYEDWSNFLFSNLISKNSIKTIVSNFINNNKIGIIIPPIFQKAFHWELKLDKQDKENMTYLLNKMNINFEPNESNFIFPAGNMFWFRPKALKKLFDLNLSYNDMPKEPVSNVWTILHAIERIYCIVSENEGFITKSHISREVLINSFFKIYDYEEQQYISKEIIILKIKKIIILKIIFNNEYSIINFLGIKIKIKNVKSC